MAASQEGRALELMGPQAGLAGASGSPAQQVCSRWPSAWLFRKSFLLDGQMQSPDWAAGGRKSIVVSGSNPECLLGADLAGFQK